MKKLFYPSLALALACLTLAACQTTKMPEKLATSLRSVQAELASARTCVVNATAATRNLRDNRGADIKPQFTSFQANLAALESKVGGVQTVGMITDDKANAFFQKWESEIKQIQDQSIADAAAERRKEVMAAFDALKVDIGDLRRSYRAYYSALVDVRTAMNADVTAQGAAVARPSMKKAIDESPDVLAKLDALNKKIDKLVH